MESKASVVILVGALCNSLYKDTLTIKFTDSLTAPRGNLSKCQIRWFEVLLIARKNDKKLAY